jgi:hypothetical protein
MFFCVSWDSERETIILCRREIKNVIGIQVDDQSYKNDDREQDKTCAVVHGCKKGEQKDPEEKIVSHPNQGKRVCAPLLD